jgi:hypothetical protein
MSVPSQDQVCPYFRRHSEAEAVRDLPNIANQCVALDTPLAIDLQYQLSTCMSAAQAWTGCSQYVIATAAEKRAAESVMPIPPAGEDQGPDTIEEPEAIPPLEAQAAHQQRSRFEVLPVKGAAGRPGSSGVTRTWWWFTSGLSPRFLSCALIVALVPIVALVMIALFLARSGSPGAGQPTATSALAFLTNTVAPGPTTALPVNSNPTELPSPSPVPPTDTALVVIPTEPQPSETPSLVPSPTAMLAVTSTETAATPTATVVPTLTPSPTPTSTQPPTQSPTQQPASTATRRPTATATRRPTPTATQVAMRFAAPVLQTPSDQQNFSEGEPILLQWQPVGTLGSNEFYVVTLAYSHSGATWYDDVPWTKDTQWLASQHEYLLDLSDDGRFVWSVQVTRQLGVDAGGRPTGPAVSPMSGQRTFTWTTSGGGGGGGNETPEPPPP